MPEKLVAFLIEVAKDENALKRFMENPAGEATKAGVPRDEIEILMSGDAHAIFEALRRYGDQYGPGGSIVWITYGPGPRKSPMKKKPTPPKAKKKAPRRR